MVESKQATGKPTKGRKSDPPGASAMVAAQNEATRTGPRIGLALGSGGVRGIAHVPVLEALDEMGLRPDYIAGTSMGAIMGAAHCAGMSGADIRAYVKETFADLPRLIPKIWKVRPRNLSQKLSGNKLPLMSVDPMRVLEIFLPREIPNTFEELERPLAVMAAQFYETAEARLTTGALRPALAASMAMPVIFRPVTINNIVHCDGGMVNPLPFDVLPPCDISIAVDVVGAPILDRSPNPSAIEQLFGVSQIMMQTIINVKLALCQPDILLRPDISRFRVLEFYKTGAVLKAAEPMKSELKRRLEIVMKSAQPEWAMV